MSSDINLDRIAKQAAMGTLAGQGQQINPYRKEMQHMGEQLKKLQAELTKMHADRLNLITELKMSMRINKFLYESYAEVCKELGIQISQEEFSKKFMARVTKFAEMQSPDPRVPKTEEPKESENEEKTGN